MQYKQLNNPIVDGKEFFESVWPYFNRMNPYTNIEAFNELTAMAAENLPLSARLNILNFKKHGNDHGYLLIRRLEKDPLLPKTPVFGVEARNRDTFYSETWLSIVANLLGEPFSYIQEGEGHLFHNVRPIKKNEDKLSSESSGILLDFHTETAFHPFVPDFLMLFCLRCDRHKEAQTIVSSNRHFLKHLNEQTIQVLRKKQFKTGIDYSFGNLEAERANGPVLAVLYGSDSDPLVTFDPDLMQGLNTEAEEALHAIKQAVDKTSEGILLEPGDLVIIDNRRAVHGRNQFKAYYDGYDRWLQRTYVSRNLLQSEILFSARDRVINYRFNDEKIAL